MPRPKAKNGGLRVTLPIVVDRETATRLRDQAWRERRSTASLLRELLFAGEAALARQTNTEALESPETTNATA